MREPEEPAFSAASLPALTVVARENPSPAEDLELLAADAPVDDLLYETAYRESFLIPATGKRLRGRASFTSHASAFATITTAAAIEVPTLAAKGRGVPVDLSFAMVPPRRVIQLLGDVGGATLVVAAGELPFVTMRLRTVPWDGALAALVTRVGRTILRDGAWQYIVAPGTKLPAKHGRLASTTLDLEVRAATVAQTVALVRGLAPLSLGSCSAAPITLRLRRTKLVDVVRAIEVAAGETLLENLECPPAPSATQTPGTLLGFARAGTRNAVLEAGRAPRVLAGDERAPLFDLVKPAEADPWLTTLQRTSALIRRGREWEAVVETTDGPIVVWNRETRYEEPEGLRYEVDREGVRILRGETLVRALPLAPAKN